MIYRYPLRAVASDYARAALGLGCTATPLLLAELPGVATGILGVLAGLFGLFGVQAGLRQRTRIEMSEAGLRAEPLGIRVDWSDIEALRLSYFSVRRDGREGWMELKLRGQGRTVRVDSRLEGFAEVVGRAARAAGAARLSLDTATRTNLAVLGLAEEQTGPPGAMTWR